MLSASCFGIRYSRKGKLFEGAGPSLFIDNNDIYYVLGFLCTNLADMILRALNPTINININDVLNLPLCKDSKHYNTVEKKSKDNIEISREDWDAHETSWDFQRNELIAIDKDSFWEIALVVLFLLSVNVFDNLTAFLIYGFGYFIFILFHVKELDILSKQRIN